MVGISFYVTDLQAVTLFQHTLVLNLAINQWYPQASAPGATEFIRSVMIREEHFGSVKCDFFGLGRKRFGLSRTHLGKSGGMVPYLEIISGRVDETRVRTMQIFMGIDEESREALECARAILADNVKAG